MRNSSGRLEFFRAVNDKLHFFFSININDRLLFFLLNWFFFVDHQKVFEFFLQKFHVFLVFFIFLKLLVFFYIYLKIRIIVNFYLLYILHIYVGFHYFFWLDGLKANNWLIFALINIFIIIVRSRLGLLFFLGFARLGTNGSLFEKMVNLLIYILGDISGRSFWLEVFEDLFYIKFSVYRIKIV